MINNSAKKKITYIKSYLHEVIHTRIRRLEKTKEFYGVVRVLSIKIKIYDNTK